jgi:hypothetical protein
LLVSLAVSANLPAAPSQLFVTSTTWSSLGLRWTDNAGNETGFEIQRKTGANGTYAPVGAVGAGVTNFTDGTVSSRATYYYRVVATNAFGASVYSGEVGAITPPSPIELWRLANFGTADNVGPGADGADPDGDGVVNLLEYAFGQSPNIGNALPWAFAFTNSHLTITFTRPRPAPADITYLVETTTDVATNAWDSGPAITSQSVTDNGNGTERVVVSDLAGPPNPNMHFLRLRVTRP